MNTPIPINKISYYNVYLVINNISFDINSTIIGYGNHNKKMIDAQAMQMQQMNMGTAAMNDYANNFQTGNAYGMPMMGSMANMSPNTFYFAGNAISL